MYVKRDDCTGLATGGKKTRELNFLMGDAIGEGADCIVTRGAVRSNHDRECAAAAAKLGVSCHRLLVPDVSEEYERTGNVILERLCGAEVGFPPSGLEFLYQVNDPGLRVDYAVHATGSAGTQAGLVAGIQVNGISVPHHKDKQEDALHKLACETAEFAGIRSAIARENCCGGRWLRRARPWPTDRGNG